MKRDEQRVLAGSLNLLPPSDKTPANDAIALENFRVDQEGVLRGADSLTAMAAIPGGLAIHTLFKIADFDTTAAYALGVQAIAFGIGGNGVAGAFLVGAAGTLWFYWPGYGSGTGSLTQLATFSPLSGRPLSFVIWNGFIWMLDAGPYQYKIDPGLLVGIATGFPFIATPWALRPPTLAIAATSGAAGPLTGTYQWYQTFVNRAGLETNPGPVSNSLALSAGSANLVLQGAVGTDYADAVYANLYRTGGPLGGAYQVAQFPLTFGLPTFSTIDNSSDLAITETGIQMPATNDPPPTGLASDTMGLVGPYFNRLLAWKNNKLFWSQDGVALFPGSADNSAIGNWTYVGSPDDKILSIELHSRYVTIFKQRTVWRIVGDVVAGVLEQTAATCGTVGPRGSANAGALDLMLSPDGVFTFNGGVVEPASGKLAPLFLGKQWIQFGASDLAQRAFFPAGATPFIAFFNGTALASNASAVSNCMFLFHLATGRFGLFNYLGGFPLTAAAGFGSDFEWFAGDAQGNLLVSAHATAAGQQFFIWQTAFLDQGLGDQPKHYQEIVIDAELWGATMTVWLLDNNSGSAGPLAGAPYTFTFNGTARQKFYMPLNPDEGDAGWAHISVRVQILSQAAGAVPPAIHGLYIYYAFEERDASVRGTQMLDFRSERIQLCQRLEVDLVGVGELSVTTDEPNGIIAFKTSLLPIGTAGARTIIEAKMPPNLRGRLWRIDFTPYTPANATARLYGVRGWMRELGNSQPGHWAWKDFLRGTDPDIPDVE